MLLLYYMQRWWSRYSFKITFKLFLTEFNCAYLLSEETTK
jgi:hypothetical protein